MGADILARLERSNKSWGLCLVFHLHHDINNDDETVPAWQSRVASSPPHFAISSRYPPHQDPLALLGSSYGRSEHGLRR